ncbi:hypothetical protein QQS21_009352 [Conoideocrella luteorostrata]|uniref:Zn(2)-C6 fungal-type domain-containing protein n=1 Tax=Conoideocrella luteorostrata TaxID=1105319 RepID=A0AAJ0CHD2_9HYPO|nr:hypothetical protein QQS21_009352 [Conoideocrella luteorostrata]
MDLSFPQEVAAVPQLLEQQQGLKIWSCVTCRRRKVKCDRKHPCANCVRNNIECHFPVTGRLPRRSRDPNAWRSPAQKQSELLGRLRRLENLVTEMAGQVEDSAGEHESQTTGQALIGAGMFTGGFANNYASASGELSTTESQSSGEIYEDFGKLIIERAGALHVDKGFWSIFCDEVEHIFQAIHDDSTSLQATLPLPQDQVQSPTGIGPRSPHDDHCHGFVFGGSCTSMTSSLDDLSPLPSQMLYIWKTYVENVDPFVKILHKPTMNTIISRLKGKFSSLGHGLEALLFAISLAAIISLDEDEVLQSFRTTKADLISRFRLCTERALAHTHFLTTQDVIVIQAFVIYVAMLPHIGLQQLASSLTGSLLRVACSFKLHIDPAKVLRGNLLNAIEMESRRRLWWQVCFVDSRTRDARIPDLSISETSFDTKKPSNVDDADLRVDDTLSDVPIRSPSEMTLTWIRCENWLLYRSIRRQLDAPIETHLDILKKARSHNDAEYLQHLRPDDDFDSLIKTMSQLFFAKMEQGIHRHYLKRAHSHSAGKKTGHDPRLLGIFFNFSIAILEAMHSLKTNPAWKQWAWQLQGQFPWHTVGAVFIQICQLPWTPVSERAWSLAKRLVDELPPESRKEIIWERLIRLSSMAAKHRSSQAEKATISDINALNRPQTQQSVTPGRLSVEADLLNTGSGSADATSQSGFEDGGDRWRTLTNFNELDSFDFLGDAAFPTVHGEAWETPSYEISGMSGVPQEWSDWDDLITMDLF